jgi:hypothetical protein
VAALGLWNTIEPDLLHAIRRAPEFVEGDMGDIQKDVNWMGDQLIRPAAYQEAKVAVRAHNDLQGA